jgi:hypothetical protein
MAIKKALPKASTAAQPAAPLNSDLTKAAQAQHDARQRAIDKAAQAGAQVNKAGSQAERDAAQAKVPVKEDK